MKIIIHEKNREKIAEIQSDGVIISTIQDMLDLMVNVDYKGARSIVLYEKNLNPDFFNLKSGFAGEILQKFSNYKMRLVIIGDFSKYKSKSLQDLIYECNKGNRIFFLPDSESAFRELSL